MRDVCEFNLFPFGSFQLAALEPVLQGLAAYWAGGKKIIRNLFERSKTEMNTYHNTEEANLDKSQLEMLLEALNASPSTLRRDTSGLWVLQGKERVLLDLGR